jgi:hypothetical protein
LSRNGHGVVVTAKNVLPFVPKAVLLDLMKDWGNGLISTDDMSFWCCNNYWPAAQTFDPSVPLWQQLAIRDVLEAFEWQAHDDKVTARREYWERAVEFLNCSEEDFEDRQQAFLRDCAGVT